MRWEEQPGKINDKVKAWINVTSKNGTKVLGERKRILVFLITNSTSPDFYGLTNLKILLVKISRVLFVIYLCPSVCVDWKSMGEHSAKKMESRLTRRKQRNLENWEWPLSSFSAVWPQGSILVALLPTSLFPNTRKFCARFLFSHSQN